jgi:hypothetical protein
MAMFVATLKASGVEAFIDTGSIPPGANWKQSLREAIGSADRLLLVWSKNSSKSSEVRKEVLLALGLGVPIVPCRLDSTPLWPEIAHIQWVDLRKSSMILATMQAYSGWAHRLWSDIRHSLFVRPTISQSMAEVLKQMAVELKMDPNVLEVRLTLEASDIVIV